METGLDRLSARLRCIAAQRVHQRVNGRARRETGYPRFAIVDRDSAAANGGRPGDAGANRQPKECETDEGRQDRAFRTGRGSATSHTSRQLASYQDE
jgi:hypothetical protein